jgi:FAD/FMN-containing dehydrogenase
MERRTFVRAVSAAAVVGSLPRRELLASPVRVAPPRLADVEAVTGDGARVVLTGKALSDLGAQLRGRVLLSDAAEYDEARRILSPSFNKFPALIVQPTGVADIRAAVNFAREHGGLLLAVKCGGHSWSGQSTCDKGMMIDLSRFRDVRVDAVARRAWVTGGTLLGAVDHETAPYELATPLGTVSHTGAGGLVTGGGFGRLARRFGLSVDNVMSAQVVTADGSFLNASPKENPDLFWGIRGGGGNFGIVTSFEFKLHPMQRNVIAGDIVYPVAKAREALALWADYGPGMPDELDVGFAMAQPPGNQPGIFAFNVCYSGPAANAERAIAPLRKLGTPLADSVRTMPYIALQRSGDVSDPRAQGTYLKSGFISALSKDLIDAIVGGFQGDPRRLTLLFAQQSGGAIARVPAGATAFSQRDVVANLLCIVGWKFGDDASEHIAWLRKYWPAIEKHTAGFYTNDLDPETAQSAVQANFRRNHERLVAVKNRYDPSNLFRLNANVKPTVRRG